jgi:DNA-binding response OmpR family regulator
MLSNINTRILIVDDEKSVRTLLCDVLAHKGYVCEVVKNTNEALDKLKNSAFDLALVDIMMPGQSGMELLTIIREIYPAMSVVMVTALNDVDTIVKAIEKGAADYIIKPFNIEDVRTRIDVVLKQMEQLEDRIVYHQ